jgi:hypothetical protein
MESVSPSRVYLSASSAFHGQIHPIPRDPRDPLSLSAGGRSMAGGGALPEAMGNEEIFVRGYGR